MRKDTIEYFEWKYINQFFKECLDEYGISKDYECIWGVWYDLTDECISNDSYENHWMGMIKDNVEEAIVSNSHVSWIDKLPTIIDELETELGEDAEDFVVHYSW